MTFIIFMQNNENSFIIYFTFVKLLNIENFLKTTLWLYKDLSLRNFAIYTDFSIFKSNKLYIVLITEIKCYLLNFV